MATNSNKKLVSIYFEELQYMAFQMLSKQKNCSASDLIREAMDSYLKNQKKNENFDDWEPLTAATSGSLKEGAEDWINKDYQDEMLGDSYDRD